MAAWMEKRKALDERITEQKAEMQRQVQEEGAHPHGGLRGESPGLRFRVQLLASSVAALPKLRQQFGFLS